jgi:hypothetical protein
MSAGKPQGFCLVARGGLSTDRKEDSVKSALPQAGGQPAHRRGAPQLPDPNPPPGPHRKKIKGLDSHPTP